MRAKDQSRLYKVYAECFSSILLRGHEEREYILRAFGVALQHEGLTVEKVRLPDRRPTDPATGPGLLLIEKKYFVDIAYAKHLTHMIILESFKRIPYGGGSLDLLIYNFGSHAPECYAPYTDEDDELLDDENNKAP